MGTENNMEDMLNMVRLFSEMQRSGPGPAQALPGRMAQNPQMKAISAAIPHLDEDSARKLTMFMMMMDFREKVAELKYIMTAMQNMK